MTTPSLRIGVLCGCALLASACVSVPSGPSVMVLPGSQTSFEQFQVDDQSCRGFALQQSGVTTEDAAAESGIVSAAVGTAVGAAAGVAIGAATGNPGAGAAIGAGSGLLLGAASGVSRADAAAYVVQQRYDSAYLQCMYAKGNQIPMRPGALRQTEPAAPPSYSRRAQPPEPYLAPGRLPPPPPPGLPPPPPPDA